MRSKATKQGYNYEPERPLFLDRLLRRFLALAVPPLLPLPVAVDVTLVLPPADPLLVLPAPPSAGGTSSLFALNLSLIHI